MRDILFMGAVIASVTHDMQNVMAIIKESGALAEDILNLNGPPRLKHGDKLEAGLANIREQVHRGRDLMLMLNGFAHAAADFPKSCDLAAFARQISVLAHRMARLKECVLEPFSQSPPLLVRGNALMLMQTVYLGLEAVLRVCSAGDSIRLSVFAPADGGENRAAARIRARDGKECPDVLELSPMMEELGGSCRSGEGFLELYYALADQEEIS